MPPWIDSIAVKLYILLMKTTIDLPDDLLHRAKVVAAQRKTTLKEMVVQGLEYATRKPFQDADTERKERAARLIAAVSCGRNTKPVGRLNREEIYDRQEGKWE